MGDVFDAMNRSQKEREAKPQSKPAHVPKGGDSDDLAPALPLDQVNARGGIADEPSPVTLPPPAPGQRTVAAAVAKADTEKQARAGIAAANLSRDPSLNGYSAQVVVHHDRGSVITEQYRAIRTQILARARNRRLQTHVITSSAPEEGKSVTTVNLGMAFSELRNQRTLLIEGDLRRPSFGRVLNRTCTPGLLQLLRGEISEIDQAIHPTVYENLQFIPAGDRDQTSSTELLSSPRMAQVLDRLKDRYDHIFIDTPPVVTVTDAAILGALSDETLLVVRLNRTPTDMVDRAKRLLRAANCEVAGIILTYLQLDAPKYLYRYG
jgi:capsular exopolysaccharide synthesis family protein